MNGPAPAQHRATRGKAIGFLAVAACVLACTLPIVGGLVAGTFFDRVLDSSAWIAAVAGVAATVAIVVARRRRSGGSGAC